MKLDNFELEKLLQVGENFRVDFKERLDGKTTLLLQEAICALSNDLPGYGQPGVIFVGVDDNGQPTGLRISDKLLRTLADIGNGGQILPPPSILIEKRAIFGSDVAVVTVKPSNSPPVRLQGRIHVRIGSRRGIATEQDERILNEKRLAQNVHFDARPVPSAKISALNRSRFVVDYLPKAFGPETLAVNDRTLTRNLAVTKMVVSADQPIPTVLGLLVIGSKPRDYLPNAWVQFLRIDGTELSDDIIDVEEIDGDLTTVLTQIDNKMKAHIRTRVDVTTSDTEIRLPTFPFTALQKIARNAIMHRNYEATNTPVRITWFNDRIEFQNPGGPFGRVTPENFGQPGITDYRNPNLAEAMKVLEFVKRFGEGIAIARKALSENGNPDLKFKLDDKFTRIVIEGRPRSQYRS